MMRDALKSFAIFVALAMLAFAVHGPALAWAQQGGAKSFRTPEKAVEALIEAARNENVPALLTVLGPATEDWITSGDAVQDEQARARFVAAYEEKRGIEKESEDKAVLVVGEDSYPFPFPLVKTASGWAFDPEQGKEEILDRRIGENELNTVQVLLATVDAQREYASEDRDGDGLLEYAARFRSSDGKKDGLYWPAADNESPSPLGPLVVNATAEGYTPQTGGAEGDETNAYHGYRFKLLTRQGADAPGGAHDYAVGDAMIGGFGVLAYPAKYGASGVMTFAVSHDGAVYETDLGPDTASEAKAINEFNPDGDWKKVDPEHTGGKRP